MSIRSMVLIAASTMLVHSAHAGAQSIGDRLKQRVKDKAGQLADQKADSLTEAAMNKGTDIVKCVIGDKSCVRKANDAGKSVLITDASGQAVPNQQQAAKDAGALKTVPVAAVAAEPTAVSATPATPPGAGVWLNYDFVPGDRTIWYEDFDGNDVGDFPRRLRLQEGNLEVVKVEGKPMLRSVNGGSFFVKLPEKLPERFTIEIRYHSPLVNPLWINTSSSTYERSATLGCLPNKASVTSNHSGGAEESGTSVEGDLPSGFVTCAFTVDNGKGIKAYVDEHRTANAPQTHVAITDTLFFQAPGSSDADPALIASIRVAAGGKKLYDVLAANGRVSTQGILFATGSDQIRPESTPTLKEIGEMLTSHPELKLTVEGHTDNVGDAAGNKSLSERRAAAVTAYLTANYGVDATRLKSVGFGATKPVATNATPEGRQNNRRVELVKRP